LQKPVIAYAEQVAFAVAVRAAETADWCAFFADNLGNLAFFRFIRLFEEHFHDFCCVVVKQVIDVPERGFIFSEVTLYPLFKIRLRGANISVQAFFEGYFAYGTYIYIDAFVYLND
jgi:hypothetical protein